MLAGVMMIAATVENAVSETESAALPPARCVMKFDMFPPGQDATNIKPRAIEGCGWVAKTRQKVRKGSKQVPLLLLSAILDDGDQPHQQRQLGGSGS